MSIVLWKEFGFVVVLHLTAQRIMVEGPPPSYQEFRDNAVRLQLHSLAYNFAKDKHADTWFAKGGRTPVAHDASGKGGEDWPGSC